ncbi:hypothetical protein PSENEW3_00003207 [Picochlorum sp. SENEW3]|nr:hypothetical protein PSENEW3_00003207 [Picochlorum sp. SENEW3]
MSLSGAAHGLTYNKTQKILHFPTLSSQTLKDIVANRLHDERIRGFVDVGGRRVFGCDRCDTIEFCPVALMCGVGATTIGEIPLCAEAYEILAAPSFSNLSAIFNATANVDIGDAPEGNLVVIIPMDSAFDDLYYVAQDSFNMTAEELLGDTDLLASILSRHIATVEGEDAKVATDIAGGTLRFEVDGSPATLLETDDANPRGISIAGSVNNVTVLPPITCSSPDGESSQVFFPSTGLLLRDPRTDWPSPSPSLDSSPNPPPGSGIRSIGGAFASIFATAVLFLL